MGPLGRRGPNLASSCMGSRPLFSSDSWMRPDRGSPAAPALGAAAVTRGAVLQGGGRRLTRPFTGSERRRAFVVPSYHRNQDNSPEKKPHLDDPRSRDNPSRAIVRSEHHLIAAANHLLVAASPRASGERALAESSSERRRIH
ncbi:hypothetical protein TNIN_419331 [Trichonephila inaurata madagascariensis]|uniref:Uncharacterized protein n=1 Tax=Trichonephila inaurata madagascariensis TaxID=2747483 RepID=A0A8X6XYL0_9ARAC|nr:hypothetical protein TNIN_419331 [Trichonephila inaurata madagascariensis]